MPFSFRPACLIAALAFAQIGSASAAHAQQMPRDLAAAFLSGRAAVAAEDFTQIAASYDRALRGDAGNPLFRELAMQGHLLSGNVARAIELAAQSQNGAEPTQASLLILQADEFLREEYEAVIGALEDGRRTGPLTDSMGVAWAELGKGRMSEALSAFDRAIEGREELAPFAQYQKALALAHVGDLERADMILSEQASSGFGLSRRAVLAHVTILSQLGRNEDAIELATLIFGSTPDDDVAVLVATMQDGELIPFTTITSARDGMAEVYYTLATALVGDRGDWLPIIYARLALALRPDHADAILLTGQLMERAEQYMLAEAVYETMPREHPQYLSAELGRANALYQSGQEDEAIEQLRALSEERPDSVLVHSTLGDMLRRTEQFAEAAASYTDAIDLLDEVEERHWTLLYTRAISYERMGEWDLAEAEFRRVLEFVPDEPQVLNYLGYSLVEQRSNLDEALEMIERAVEGDPESGYITDSLGWAYYRLGRYEDAVPVMERAVELLPSDPILNDHLGDVYWAVGREREARFQWRRALSFAPHPDLDLDRVRRKLEVGLDVVLEEEAAQE